MRIVIAHDDPEFRESVTAALQAARYETRAFAGSMEAIDALQAAEQIELLITRVAFPEGTPNGVTRRNHEGLSTNHFRRGKAAAPLPSG